VKRGAESAQYARLFKPRDRARRKECTGVQQTGGNGIKEEVEVSDYLPERGLPMWGARGGRQGCQPPAIQGGVS
jgi:hypothetical protein